MSAGTSPRRGTGQPTAPERLRLLLRVQPEAPAGQEQSRGPDRKAHLGCRVERDCGQLRTQASRADPRLRGPGADQRAQGP